MSDSLFPIMLLLSLLCILSVFYSIWLIQAVRAAIRRYGRMNNIAALAKPERRKGG